MILLQNEDFEQLKQIFTKLGVILQHADYSIEEQASIARQSRMIASLITAAKEEREKKTESGKNLSERHLPKFIRS